MRVSDFNFELPPELIAQEPLAERTSSRMLVMERETGECELRNFRDFPEFVRAGDITYFGMHGGAGRMKMDP